MNDNIGERIAIALEQIALELATPRIFEGIRPIEAEVQVQNAPAVTAPAFPPIGQTTPPGVGVCPDHGYDWKVGKRGLFCSGKTPDGAWCARTPQTTTRALP